MAGRTMIGMVALALTIAPAGLEAAALQATPPETKAAEAYELFADPAKWGKAAGLLLSAAESTDRADARAIAWAQHAGRAYVAAGRPDRARVAFELSAERALAQGAVEAAAHAYLDAALVAARERDAARAREFTDRARLLSASPHLPSASREAILARIA